MSRTFIVTILMALCATACLAEAFDYTTKNGHSGRIILHQYSDSAYCLEHTIDGKSVSRWKLAYPVYRFEVADLTGDSVPDIAVGVIKRTRYFKNGDGKRLFLFKLFDGKYIRPLWLGSKVAHHLEDFSLEPCDSLGHSIVHTHEIRQDSTAVEAYYEQRGFGLRFMRWGDVSVAK